MYRAARMYRGIREARMVRSLLLLLLVLASVPVATLAAPDLDKWLGRSVYFVVTDRFARDDASNASTRGGLEFCGNGTKEWCGGTFKGVMSKLDYIAGMGFDAIWITPVVKQVTWRDHWNGTGYHGASKRK
jgi:alpha-amylase